MKDIPLFRSRNLKLSFCSNLEESRHVEVGLGANCFFSDEVIGFIRLESNPNSFANINAKSNLFTHVGPVA